MAFETCPTCSQVFSVRSIQDKQRPPSLVDIVCPYDGTHIRSETTTKRFVCVPLSINERARRIHPALP